MDGSPLAYNLSEEISAHPASGACTDECGSTCPTHHNNVHRIASELYDEYWERNHVVVMWSDYPNDTYCARDYYELHQTIAAHALVTKVQVGSEYVHQPIVQIINLDNSHAQNGICSVYDLMSLLIAHEIAHTLGLAEVYNGAYGDPDTHKTNNSTCIMGKVTYSNVDNIVASGSSALCSACRSNLAGELADDVYEN
jgi:hypothetical protein